MRHLCAFLVLAASILTPAMAQQPVPGGYPSVVSMGYGATGSPYVPVSSANPLPVTMAGGAGAASQQTQGTSADGSPPVGNPNLIAGSDGSATRTVRTDTAGNIQNVGTAATGASLTTAPVAVAGTDSGGLVRTLRTDAFTNDALASGVLGLSVNARLMAFDGTNSVRARDAISASGTTGTGLLGVGVLGRYNSAQQNYTDGLYGPLALTARGSVTIGTVGAVSLGTSNSNAYAALHERTGGIGPLLVQPTLYTGSASVPAAGSTFGANVLPTPTPDATNALVGVVSTAAESGRVLKASGGNVYRLVVTTGAQAGYLMVFNSTTVPADGAVTPAMCRVVAANATYTTSMADMPAAFSTGISVAFSSTGCFTKTASATAYFEGYVR